MAEKMFPLEDTEYLAEDAQLYFCTRSTGVYAAGSFPVQSVSGMKITIGKGIAWLKYSDFGGVVYANTTNKELTIGLSPAQNTRIDGICVKYDPITRTQSAMYVKQGTAAASPSAPTLTRDTTGYEIMLYTVTVAAGVTEITSADITDKRLDADVCGVMADSITSVDTSAIAQQIAGLIERMESQTNAATASVQAQATAKLSAIQTQADTAIAGIESQLEQVYDVEAINYQVLSASVPVSAWSLENGLYKAAVTVTGLLASDHPTIDIYQAESDVASLSAMWESWCVVLAAYSATGSLILYATDLPEAALELRLEVIR